MADIWFKAGGLHLHNCMWSLGWAWICDFPLAKVTIYEDVSEEEVLHMLTQFQQEFERAQDGPQAQGRAPAQAMAEVVTLEPLQHPSPSHSVQDMEMSEPEGEEDIEAESPGLGKDTQGQDVRTKEEEAQQEGPEKARAGMKRVSSGEEEEAVPSKRHKGGEDQESSSSSTDEDLVPVICPQGVILVAGLPLSSPIEQFTPSQED
ncbi:hypothetical protein FRC10_000914 [Ceratobasidium sp. 414]|nr:hypothetical protein FRC10_000914 [Ceratobasidium sp. 414]